MDGDTDVDDGEHQDIDIALPEPPARAVEGQQPGSGADPGNLDTRRKELCEAWPAAEKIGASPVSIAAQTGLPSCSQSSQRPVSTKSIPRAPSREPPFSGTAWEAVPFGAINPAIDLKRNDYYYVRIQGAGFSPYQFVSLQCVWAQDGSPSTGGKIDPDPEIRIDKDGSFTHDFQVAPLDPSALVTASVVATEMNFLSLRSVVKQTFRFEKWVPKACCIRPHFRK